MPQEKITAAAEDAKELADAQNEYVAPANPLQDIALCLSGGGFRAASFSLGVLSYLDKIKIKHKAEEKERSLLESVKFITSTSGGSITNAFYSVAVYRQNSFADFYKQMKRNLEGEGLLKDAFTILKDDTQWTEEGVLVDDKGVKTIIRKQRNLINAFAKSYDKRLINSPTLSVITGANSDKSVKPPHLEEIAFNTTEFNNGLPFYIQANGHNGYVRYMGNGYLKFTDTDVVKQLKISDLVASSSCFPGGFEPMLYPYDFVHQSNTDVNALLKGMEYGYNDPGEVCKVKNQPFS
ncbi:MAG TPA: patatin-like phospholipase family protein, partial [Chitinophagaceae bacterium]|nr:patatin-like phospholipase family protein [Chitinophagaceae bacterium]